MEKKIKNELINMFNNGELEELYTIINPMLEERDGDALYFYSCFSLSDWNESHEQFEKRSLKLLIEAAEKGVPEALYKLAVFYSIGDNVKKDDIKASNLFMKAAKQGHPRSKLSYGLDLFYGNNEIKKDENLGLAFISQAANENVEGAYKMLEKLNKGKQFKKTTYKPPSAPS